MKLIGTAQRLVRGGALLGASDRPVGDGPGVRAVLEEVYAALEFDWDATTAGAIDEEVPGLSLDAVERAVIAAFGDELSGRRWTRKPSPSPAGSNRNAEPRLARRWSPLSSSACSRPLSFAVSAASCATCLPRSSASCRSAWRGR